MTPGQKHALALLEKLTPLTVKTRAWRFSHFLTSPASTPAYDLVPQDWPGGWCADWAFSIQPSLADALDIQLVPRVLKGKRSLEWTQGSSFDFRTGYTIHDAPEKTGEPWREECQRIRVSLQIKEALPAVPATTSKDANEQVEYIPRNPGLVIFQVFHFDAAENVLLPHEIHSVTQDQFVRILIAGLPAFLGA